MNTIGEIARRTGVSHRRLRHWEHEGLLVPAEVAAGTGRRRYDDAQIGRVRTIARLRDQGFGLEEIRRLLDPRLDHADLQSILLAQAAVLRERITAATAQLEAVERRQETLDAAQEQIAAGLVLEPLPATTLWGRSRRVRDEVEIGAAVSACLEGLPDTGRDLVLLYDGTLDGEIVVSAGTSAPLPDSALGEVNAPAADLGVTVCFDPLTADVGDAWILIDAELERRGLATCGIYRQTIGADGTTTLQAPVRQC